MRHRDDNLGNLTTDDVVPGDAREFGALPPRTPQPAVLMRAARPIVFDDEKTCVRPSLSDASGSNPRISSRPSLPPVVTTQPAITAHALPDTSVGSARGQRLQSMMWTAGVVSMVAAGALLGAIFIGPPSRFSRGPAAVPPVVASIAHAEAKAVSAGNAPDTELEIISDGPTPTQSPSGTVFEELTIEVAPPPVPAAQSAPRAARPAAGIVDARLWKKRAAKVAGAAEPAATTKEASASEKIEKAEKAEKPEKSEKPPGERTVDDALKLAKEQLESTF